MPLNLYLEHADDAQRAHAMREYGDALKELAAVNIFAGDLLFKNFGVTRFGRVVFYDYDEIEYLTDCNFRRIPPPPPGWDEMSGDVWYPVGPHDVFPEEFETFLLTDPKTRECFLYYHARPPRRAVVAGDAGASCAAAGPSRCCRIPTPRASRARRRGLSVAAPAVGAVDGCAARGKFALDLPGSPDHVRPHPAARAGARRCRRRRRRLPGDEQEGGRGGREEHVRLPARRRAPRDPVRRRRGPAADARRRTGDPLPDRGGIRRALHQRLPGASRQGHGAAARPRLGAFRRSWVACPTCRTRRVDRRAPPQREQRSRRCPSSRCAAARCACSSSPGWRFSPPARPRRRRRAARRRGPRWRPSPAAASGAWSRRSTSSTACWRRRRATWAARSGSRPTNRSPRARPGTPRSSRSATTRRA